MEPLFTYPFKNPFIVEEEIVTLTPYEDTDTWTDTEAWND